MLYLVAALELSKAGCGTKFNDHLARAVGMRPTSYRIIVTSIFTSLRFRGKSKVALFVREKKKFGDKSEMKWVTAIIALSLLSLFSNATNSANLDGKVFSPFDKHFSPSYSLAGYDFGLSNRNNGLNCCYLCQPFYSVSKGFA